MSENITEEANHAYRNLHDDRLKLYLDQSDRIPHEEYLALKKLGLAWWRGSKCLSGVWTLECEDAILGYVDEIEFFVDDCGLVYRLERFGGYSDKAKARAQAEQQRLDDLLDLIPPGQPILPAPACPLDCVGQAGAPSWPGRDRAGTGGRPHLGTGRAPRDLGRGQG